MLIKVNIIDYIIFAGTPNGKIRVFKITDEYRLDYTSSDESVVKIVDDSFVAVGEGLATITVSFNGNDKYESADDASFKVGVFKKESSIDIEPKSVEIVAGEDAPITVILPEDATGIVLVDVGDNKYYGDVENGNATVNIAGLTAGNYTAKVIYPGDDKYINASSSVSIKVNEIPEPVDSKVNVTVPDVKAGEDAKVVVELPSDATGNVVAENTQDTVSIIPANKWVKLAADATNDTITVGHVVNNIDITNATATDINGNGNTVIKLYYTRNSYTVTLNKSVDKAGTVTGNGTYKYGKSIT